MKTLFVLCVMALFWFDFYDNDQQDNSVDTVEEQTISPLLRFRR